VAKSKKKAPKAQKKIDTGLPDTVGGGGNDGYDGTIDDFMKNFPDQRGKSLEQASKELGAEADYKTLMKMKLPKTPRAEKSAAIKAKKAAPGAYYNRGQRASKNVEDGRTVSSPTLEFLKHNITNKKGK
jgi:hypothetical protein